MLILLGARFGYVTQMLAAPTASTSSFNNHQSSAFLNRSSRHVFKLVTTSETILDSSFCRNSGMGKISFPFKQSAYLPTRSFSYSSESQCWIFHGDVTGFVNHELSPCWIGLSICNCEESGKDGQLDQIRLVSWVSCPSRSVVCFGRASFSMRTASGVGKAGSLVFAGHG